jgi:hypothetical protein
MRLAAEADVHDATKEAVGGSWRDQRERQENTGQKQHRRSDMKFNYRFRRLMVLTAPRGDLKMGDY